MSAKSLNAVNPASHSQELLMDLMGTMLEIAASPPLHRRHGAVSAIVRWAFIGQARAQLDAAGRPLRTSTPALPTPHTPARSSRSISTGATT